MKKITTITFCLSLLLQTGLAQKAMPVHSTPLNSNVNTEEMKKDNWNVLLKNITVKNIEPQKNPNRSKDSVPSNLGKFFPRPQVTNPLTPVVKRGFKGSNSGYSPHDNGTGVGKGDYLVQAINSNIIFTDLNGVETFSNSLSSFFNVNATPVDPRVVFDPYENKWIVVAMPTSYAAILIAFSDDENPNGTWHTYDIEIAGGGGIYDYPHCGVTENELIVSGFASTTGKCHALQVSKSDGYAGVNIRSKEYQVDGDYSTSVVNTGRGDVLFGNKAYLASTYNNGGSTFDLYTFTDTIGGNPTLEKSAIPIDEYYDGPKAQQKLGYVLGGNNCRVYNAIFMDGKVHFVTISDYYQTGFHAVLYGIVDVQTKQAKTHLFNLPDRSLHFPSISSFTSGKNGNNVAIFFLESNRQMYPSSRVVLCDDQGNWSESAIVKEGTGPIPGPGKARWGDYTASAKKFDAQIPTVWVSGEYGDASGRATWIAEISTDQTVGVEKKVDIVTQGSVYPNPVITENFNVKFNLTTDQNIKIDLYGLNGQLIANLYNERALKGMNKFSFHRNNLNAGIYFLNITNSKNEVVDQIKVLI